MLRPCVGISLDVVQRNRKTGPVWLGAGPCIPPSSCKLYRDFPDGPVVKTLPSNARGTGSIPGQGIKILYAEPCGKKKKK